MNGECRRCRTHEQQAAHQALSAEKQRTNLKVRKRRHWRRRYQARRHANKQKSDSNKKATSTVRVLTAMTPMRCSSLRNSNRCTMPHSCNAQTKHELQTKHESLVAEAPDEARWHTTHQSRQGRSGATQRGKQHSEANTINSADRRKDRAQAAHLSAQHFIADDLHALATHVGFDAGHRPL